MAMSMPLPSMTCAAIAFKWQLAAILFTWQLAPLLLQWQWAPHILQIAMGTPPLEMTMGSPSHSWPQQGPLSLKWQLAVTPSQNKCYMYFVIFICSIYNIFYQIHAINYARLKLQWACPPTPLMAWAALKGKGPFPLNDIW